MFRGVLIDIEKALWKVEEDAAHQDEAKNRLALQLGHPDPAALWGIIASRLRRYQTWAEAECRELGDFALWHEWLYPESDETQLRFTCHSLTSLLRQAEGRRKTHPGALRTIRALYDRGCRLGIVSNSIGEQEAPGWLEETGTKQYFETVVISALCGTRKPDSRLFSIACEELGLPPAECASIGYGSTEGEKAAGIGASIRLAGMEGQDRPDYIVDRFSEILELPGLR